MKKLLIVLTLKNGLAYTNSPWQHNHTFLDSISYLYGAGNYDSYRPLTDSSFGKTDYLQKLCDINKN